MTFRTAASLSTLALVAALGPSPAAAGSFGVEGQAGYFSMSAKKSAEAVFDGSTGGGTYGGAVRYTFHKGFYVEAGARTFTKKGERVFLATASGPVAKLGFPLEIRITPIFGLVGYRFRDGHSLVPYVGVGGGSTQYKETSDVTGDVQDTSQSKGAFHGVVGLEYGRGLVRVGAEGGYSSVSKALGLGGVTKVYNETNLGGFTVVGKLVLTFGK